MITYGTPSKGPCRDCQKIKGTRHPELKKARESIQAEVWFSAKMAQLALPDRHARQSELLSPDNY